jgi:serpin B
MKHLPPVFALLSLFLSTVSAAEAQPTNDNNTFAFAFYHQLQAANNGNLVFSLVAIRSTFAMLAEGSKGATRDEIDRALHFSDQNYGINSLQKQLHIWEAATKLQTFNGMWFAKELSILPDYTKKIQSNYRCLSSTADFRDNANGELTRLNNTIAKATNNKITNLFSPQTVNTQTKFILASAVYFKGKWHHPFDETATKYQTFYESTTQQQPAPFMSQTQTLAYAEDGKNQYLRLPYNKSTMFMLLVLPKLNDTNDQVPKPTLTTTELYSALNSTSLQKVLLELPRFKIKCSPNLSAILQQLGIHLAFSSAPDFSGITGQPGSAISVALHQATIDVDEEGTEAAAATTFSNLFGIAVTPPKPPVKFIANHPFLFFILDRETNAILFMGRVSEP